MNGRDYDIIVLGSGVAGLSAATVAAAEGCRVLLLEASPLIGGTSAISGGMLWLPGSERDGDSIDAARLYLSKAAPAAPDAVREAFLARATEARDYLTARTGLKLQSVPVYPDYHPNLPGASMRGRCFEAQPFSGTELGPYFDLLRPPLPEFMLFDGMMVARADLPHFRNVFRSPVSALRVATLTARYLLQRLGHRRGTSLVLGNALIARLLKSALSLGVEVRTGTAGQRLLGTPDRVEGIQIAGSGHNELSARKAVILATGGFSHDAELRRAYLPPAVQDVTANIVSPGPAGARLALDFGVAIAGADENPAFWVPTSYHVDSDGVRNMFPHTVTDRGKPGVIAVDRTGRRFTNEARPYHDFVLAMLRQGESAATAHLICDSAFLWKYGLGRIKPFSFNRQKELASNYLIEAPTIAALAERINVPIAALMNTVARYNAGAEKGEDPEFGRGGEAYQRHFGDPAQKPNPCVAPLSNPPFYAVKVHPAEMGTAAGLPTDDKARVLADDGAPIAGLYACGNDMHSVMHGCYPGPGITLGPALTFGYIAARHAAAL